ncbi:MAG: TonB family protein [Kiritimatiellia bacterium]|jgi:TonB family protein
MNRRVFTFIAGLHGALIVSLVFAGMLKGCLPKKEKPSIIAVVNIAPMSVATPMPTPPSPVEPPPKAPTPEPPSEPVKPPEPEKPKRKAKTPDEIRQRVKDMKKVERVVENEVVKKPVKQEIKPMLRPEDLKNLIDSPRQPYVPTAPSAQTMSAMQEVLVDLQRKGYATWEKPDGLTSSFGKVTSVRFRVNRVGRVIECDLENSSGLTLMDQSVMRAAAAIKTVKRLPGSYNGAHFDFIIDFKLTD